MTEISAAHPLDSLRGIVLKLFPWLARIGGGPGEDLTIRSATSRIHLAGDKADPAVARVGDSGKGGRLAWDPAGGGPGVGVLYYSPSLTAPYAAVAVTVGPPPPVFAGTQVDTVITVGSSKVTCG